MNKGDGFGFLFFLCAACTSIWHKVPVFENETGLFLLVAWLCLCNNGRIPRDKKYRCVHRGRLSVCVIDRVS